MAHLSSSFCCDSKHEQDCMIINKFRPLSPEAKKLILYFSQLPERQQTIVKMALHADLSDSFWTKAWAKVVQAMMAVLQGMVTIPPVRGRLCPWLTYVFVCNYCKAKAHSPKDNGVIWIEIWVPVNHRIWPWKYPLPMYQFEIVSSNSSLAVLAKVSQPKLSGSIFTYLVLMIYDMWSQGPTWWI